MEIQNLQDTYYLLTAVSAVVILTLSFLLISIRFPHDVQYQKINKARLYLSLSYFILGATGIFSCTLSEDSTKSVLLLLITASVASFQSLLFTATHVAFIQPNVLKQNKILNHIIIITFWIFCLGIIYRYRLVNDYILVSLIVISYLIQQTFFTFKFHKLHHQCVQQMEQYYDEEQHSRLKWINYSFYSALSIGLLSILSSVSGLRMYTIFIILYTLFYTYIVVLVINNKFITKVIYPAISQPVTEEVPVADNIMKIKKNETIKSEISVETDHTHENPQEKDFILFKQKLDTWLSQKCYLQKDLSVDDIANMLGTNRDHLRYFFRTYIHTDFRTWRSELRIKEAKNIMIEHPDFSFTKISEMVGFNHRANFFNQFVKIEGMTPTEWRDQQIHE